ncbi:MAG: twin-arginine translocation signal domain-containing protein [Phycisphaerae bacterium]|nr:twin-arginine translocation signal domain-containing protein [Phycisphaerae bacterium]
MTTSRRDFVRYSVAAGAAVALGSFPVARGADALKTSSGKGLRILILGGTGFLGPAVVEAARARGHTLTLFNRGRTDKRKEELYGEPIFPDIEKIYGNRDPDKHAVDDDPASPKGLVGLEGDRTWDAVVDTSGYYPRIVGASAQLLKDRVKHYTFISSVSVYRDNATPGGDETREVGTIPDPTVEEMGADFSNYGPLKALCEQAAEAAMPGRVANIRPGFIVGRWDPSDRFTYWPVRVDKGGEVLAPGTPDDPIQIIDVRDLGEWIIHCIEHNVTGLYNALGPATPLKWGDVLNACQAAAANPSTLTWVDHEFLAQNGLPPGSLPIWIPPTGEMAGFHRWNCDKSVAAGLKFRSITNTVNDTIAWWRALPESRRNARMRAGIEQEQEAAVLAKWKER